MNVEWGPTHREVGSVTREEIADLAGVDAGFVERLTELVVYSARSQR